MLDWLRDRDHGSGAGLHLVVSDIVATRAELAGRGVDVGEVRHLESGMWVPGPHPQRGDYESFAHFSDLDANTWVLQEGRVERGPGLTAAIADSTAVPLAG